jgi:hypothetical protein
MAELLLLAAEVAAPEALAAAGAEAGAEVLAADALASAGGAELGIPQLLSEGAFNPTTSFMYPQEAYSPFGSPELFPPSELPPGGVPEVTSNAPYPYYPSGPEATPPGMPESVPPAPVDPYTPSGPEATPQQMEEALRRAQEQGGIKDLLKDPLNKLDAYVKANPYKSIFYANTLLEALKKQKTQKPPTYSGPQILNRYRWAGKRGGIASLAGGGPALPGYDMAVGEQAMYPQPYARGGISDLGTYSDGGRMLKGPGDGMSDSIPGVIANKRPARLADGEFVVPADVVSHLGNGSTDAGAKQLYKMMNKVRSARTGTTKQGRQINPRRFMPA